MAKKELVTMNLSILMGLNLTLDANSQSLFGTFVITAFTSKHSSIKQIVIWSKRTFVKILSVNIGLLGLAITS